LEAQDKELQGNLHVVLKTAEALVSEADDKLKKSITQKDIEQVSVAQAILVIICPVNAL